MKDYRPIRARLALLVALLISGCSQVHTIDGFPVGPRHECVGGPPTCAEITEVALAALEARDPGHPHVTSWTVYGEDMRLLHEKGMGRSGSLSVVVFDLIDGTQRAIGVYSGVGGLMPIPRYSSALPDGPQDAAA
jgi:hypothetical protein